MAIPDTMAAAAFPLPQHRPRHAVSSELVSGQIGATALDAGPPSGAGATARLDPSRVKSRIDGLVDEAVTNGTITDDQAATLKSLFSRGAAQADEAGTARAGGPPSAGSNDSVFGEARMEVAGTETSSATDLLATFIKRLQSGQGQGSGYGTTGASGGRPPGPRIVDFEA